MRTTTKAKCRYCGKLMNDLTHGVDNGRNFICPCGAHLYHHMISFFQNSYEELPVWFSKQEWEEFVETQD